MGRAFDVRWLRTINIYMVRPSREKTCHARLNGHSVRNILLRILMHIPYICGCNLANCKFTGSMAQQATLLSANNARGEERR
jgi:hypothetical protein